MVAVAVIITGILMASLLGGFIISTQLDPFNHNSNITGTPLGTSSNFALKNDTQASKPVEQFNAWDWLREPNWGQIVWGMVTGPFQFFKWLNEALSAGACWVIKGFSHDYVCSDWLGWLILVPLFIYLIWVISNKLLSLSTKWASILIMILGAIFAIGIALVFLHII